MAGVGTGAPDAQRGFELEPDELPDVPDVPLFPVVEPLGERVVLPELEVSEGLPLVVPPMLPPERVFTSAPASMPVERGRFAPRRPSGAPVVLVVPARPPLFELQAPTPANMAAADAKVIHL